MLTPKQKKQLRVLINKNPSVEYQEQLDNEAFAIKEIKRFAEREKIILQRQIGAANLSLKLLDQQKLENNKQKQSIEDQEKQLQKQKEQLLKQLEVLSD